VKMRYNIDTHDYDVRLRSSQKFLSNGDKVKVICQFRGRENDFDTSGERCSTDLWKISKSMEL
jgi:translation initiation factor IF-3